MRLPTSILPPGEPDPTWLRRLFIAQWIGLALVFLLALATFAVWLIPDLDPALGFLVDHTSPAMALVELGCVFSLVLTEPSNRPFTALVGRYCAAVPALLSMVAIVIVAVPLSPVPGFFQDLPVNPSGQPGLSPQPLAAFLLIAVILLLVRTDNEHVRSASDALVCCLCLIALVLASQDLFGKLSLFSLTPGDLVSPQVLLPFSLLTLVVAFRQASHGVFSIFLGGGIGSRIARGFAPVLILWPFVREIAEAQLAFRGLLPAHYSTALLTSFAVAFSLLLLLTIVWRINEMEKEIHDLTLRDDLTGLYNMRGFYLLAEQTLRLAQRTQQPFAVLFLDLDGLKQINDHLGHNVGSAYLRETGAILEKNFRNSDIKGRFGGDEFVVAGQFTAVGIELAASRLRAAADEQNAKIARTYPLSFSIGYVTTDHYSNEPLKDMVTRADNLMYDDKRRKKKARA